MKRDGEQDLKGAETRKPVTGSFRKTADRLRQGKETALSNRAALDWRLDQRTVCDVNGFAADVVAIDTLKDIILQSRTAQQMLEDKAAENLEIIYDAQNAGSQFYLHGGRKIITLNPLRPKGELVNMLARELRRLHQQAQGALVSPLSFEPEEAILVNRAQQADAYIMSVKIAWELKLAGFNEAWDTMAASAAGDVNRTFELKAKADFRSLNNGEAARAAYDKFFEGAHTRAVDKRVIHQMLLEETGYIKSPAKTEKLGMDLFRKLGDVPQGRNYLSMSSKDIPTDSKYASVEDRANANFLWFIKFERSFQEKEQQMIAESLKLSAQVIDFAKMSAARTARHQQLA